MNSLLEVIRYWLVVSCCWYVGSLVVVWLFGTLVVLVLETNGGRKGRRLVLLLRVHTVVAS
jgi:formate/nitrite transporter FocA (FNT family)